MEPITILLTALGGAAAALGKEAADDAVKTTYEKLKALVVGRFKSKPDVEDALIKVEGRPESQVRQAALQEELELVQVPADNDVMQQAEVLLQLLSEKGLLQGMVYQAKLEGSGAIAQGQGNVVGGERSINILGNVYGDIGGVQDPKTEQERLKVYLRRFVANYRSLPLRGMDVGTSDPTSPQISVI